MSAAVKRVDKPGYKSKPMKPDFMVFAWPYLDASMCLTIAKRFALTQLEQIDPTAAINSYLGKLV